jgi:hypothetical protein
MTTSPRKTARLAERIADLRREIDGIIDARVAMLAGESPGVPSGVIRNLLTARAPACRCAQYLDLCGQDVAQDE